MAGAGYKLFATGDVLTAAQVNTYLNEQTVMVFADSAARTTALSGVLAEGMMSYLQDTNAVEVYNGTAWVGVSGAGDVTEVQAGTGISVASGTGPIPVVTNTMATEITAKGDLIVGTGSGTFDNLPAGTNGHTLVADSVETTGLKWVAPAAGGSNWSLLNAGGTALTGASTITVSGISAKESILVIFRDASSANASSVFGVQMNADTGTNYDTYGTFVRGTSTYSADVTGRVSWTDYNFIVLGNMTSNAGSAASGYCLIQGANAAGIKPIQAACGFDRAGGNSHDNNIVGGFYSGSSTISSVSLRSSTGNFDAGTLFVYTTA
jgi:hypothetical protein